MDSVGHEVIHELESPRKVDGKEARNEMAKEDGRVASPKAEKVEPRRKVEHIERQASVSANS